MNGNDIRKCPLCSLDMKHVMIENQKIDQCQCGFFFDEGELESILQLFDYTEDVHLDEEDIFTEKISKEDGDRKLRCPKDQSLMKPEYLVKPVIDRCPTCDGIWLDQGELIVLKLVEKSIKENLTLYIRLGE